MDISPLPQKINGGFRPAIPPDTTATADAVEGSTQTSTPPRPAKRPRIDIAIATTTVSRPSQRLPCWPFNKYRPLPSAAERARLRALIQGSAEWLAARELAQGASGASCAVGLGPATPRDYWRLKTGRIVREDTPQGLWIMKRGNRLEPLAADAYAQLRGVELSTVGIVVHPTLAWIQCSPDRLIARGEGEGGVGILEIKCPAHALPIRIADQYMCQVQLQMQCTGAQWCDLFCFYYTDPADAAPDMNNDQSAGAQVAAATACMWRIWRSDAYWQAMLGPLSAFADCLMEDREPTARDVPLRPTMPPVRTELLVSEHRCM